MTDKEFKELRDQVKSILNYSQDVECNDTIIDEMMEEWRQNKSWFIERLKGQMIYKLPYKSTFALSTSAKTRNFNRIVDQITFNIIGSSELSLFLEMQGVEAFYKNEVVKDYETYSGQKINKGMKLVKAFKYFISNKDDLVDMQNFASRLIQEDRMEGYLCISVHPLDYLSMSENTYKWRSCHALDGEYCAGDLSYMCDKSSLVCYVCGDEDVELPHFPADIKWNSKKWRMMLYVEDEERGLLAGRQYPFDLEGVLRYLRDRILNPVLFNDCVEYWHGNIIKHWEDTESEITGGYYLDTPYMFDASKLFPLSDIVEDAPESCHYNDLLRSSVYAPKSAIINKTKSFHFDTHYWKKVHFTVGSASKCLKCGKPVDQGESTMLCSDCYLIYGADNGTVGYCEICGRRHYIEDLIEVGDDGNALICEECLPEAARQCDSCGNWYLMDEIHEVDRGGYSDYLCEWCYRDYLDEQKGKENPYKITKITGWRFYNKNTDEVIMNQDNSDIASFTIDIED